MTPLRPYSLILQLLTRWRERATLSTMKSVERSCEGGHQKTEEMKGTMVLGTLESSGRPGSAMELNKSKALLRRPSLEADVCRLSRVGFPEEALRTPSPTTGHELPISFVSGRVNCSQTAAEASRGAVGTELQQSRNSPESRRIPLSTAPVKNRAPGRPERILRRLYGISSNSNYRVRTMHNRYFWFVIGIIYIRVCFLLPIYEFFAIINNVCSMIYSGS